MASLSMLDCFLPGHHHGGVGDLLEPEAEQQTARAACDAGIFAGYFKEECDYVVKCELLCRLRRSE